MKVVRLLPIIFMILLLSCSTYKFRVVDGGKFAEPEFSHFIGAWEWSNKDELFRIELKPKIVEFPKGSFTDLVMGHHLYVRYGDTIQFASELHGTKKSQLEGYALFGFVDNNNNSVLRLGFRDLVMNKSGTARLRPIKEDASVLKWTLGEDEGENINLIIDGDPLKQSKPGFAVPTELTLKKVR